VIKPYHWLVFVCLLGIGMAMMFSYFIVESP